MVEFAKLPNVDTTLKLLQDNIEIAFLQLDEAPFLAGKLIEGVVLTLSADTKFRHSLGYTPRGYFVCKATQNEYPTFVSADKDFLTLNNASASDNTVTLWVF